jgi:transcriptional regulator with XRE-family HTH domain
MIKWDEDTVAKFKKFDAQGLSRTVIAERMGISANNVSARRHLIRNPRVRSINIWTDAKKLEFLAITDRNEASVKYGIKVTSVLVMRSQFRADLYGIE